MKIYEFSESTYWFIAIALFIISGVTLMESILTEISIIIGIFFYIFLNMLGVFIVNICLEKYYIKVEENE